MPGYIEKALQHFNHTQSQRKQDSQHAWVRLKYGHNPQLTGPHDDSPMLPPTAITKIREITGTLLHYGHTVDPTMLVAWGTIASAQSNGIDATVQAVTQVLNYAATDPDATIRYIASDMYLHIHSDASYLSEAEARNHVSGDFFLSPKPYKPTKPPPPTQPPHTRHTMDPST
jgi:hypothetical protein